MEGVEISSFGAMEEEDGHQINKSYFVAKILILFSFFADRANSDACVMVWMQTR